MKKKEFEKLLGLFDQKDQPVQDFSGFKEPDRAKGLFRQLIFYRFMLSGNKKVFSPYFADQVMNRIINANHVHGIEEYLSLQFNRVMSFGLAATILFYLALYFFQGHEEFSTIFGIDRSNDINFISYLFYEF